ncbi:hypothetical protein C8F01DRAFT_1123614 [Mycena amicta]|nr:hypothetical protein C8F01DRAFT_1123614 [Mycena amicta]
MILEKTTIDEAPPAYESAVASSSSARPPDNKNVSLPSSPIPKSSGSTAFASKWYNLAFPSPTSRHVRSTVLGLIKDLVKLPPADHSVVAINILKSCAEACAANNLSISAILQERSIEGHTALYWAVVKRPPESTSSNEALDLLAALLSLSAPLTPATISDVRIACLQVSDQRLFQRLRASPDFSPLSPTDALLLDAATPPDDITVEEDNSLTPGSEAAPFAVDFTIMQFQKRMRISGGVHLEFIARGRLWQLRFGVSKGDRPGYPLRGAWYLSLSLLEQSPPTWVDGRMLVPTAVDRREEDKEQSEGSAFGNGKGKQRSLPTLSLRVRGYQHRGGSGGRIIVPLDGKEADGGLGGLQYAGSPYISVDESFTGRLETRLVQPETECIIC